ncbi:unnamed protein product, partial [Mesorhabditis spiculigera]
MSNAPMKRICVALLTLSVLVPLLIFTVVGILGEEINHHRYTSFHDFQLAVVSMGIYGVITRKREFIIFTLLSSLIAVVATVKGFLYAFSVVSPSTSLSCDRSEAAESETQCAIWDVLLLVFLAALMVYTAMSALVVGRRMYEDVDSEERFDVSMRSTFQLLKGNAVEPSTSSESA